MEGCCLKKGYLDGMYAYIQRIKCYIWRGCCLTHCVDVWVYVCIFICVYRYKYIYVYIYMYISHMEVLMHIRNITYIRRSHVTHIPRSHVTYEGVMSHMKESCHIWVMSHMKESYHTYTMESCHTFTTESCHTYTKEWCHTCERVMPFCISLQHTCNTLLHVAYFEWCDMAWLIFFFEGHDLTHILCVTYLISLETWLIFSWVVWLMTRVRHDSFHSWHDLFICTTWLISLVTWLILWVVWLMTRVRQQYVQCDSFLVWHDSFPLWHDSFYEWYDSWLVWDMTRMKCHAQVYSGSGRSESFHYRVIPLYPRKTLRPRTKWVIPLYTHVQSE